MIKGKKVKEKNL